MYLLVVAAAIFVCCLAIQTSTIRLAFGMSRDERLPLSKTLSKVNPRWHTPMGACIAIGVLAFIPMLQYTGAAIVAIAATGMIYLSYLMCNFAVLRARMKGWPKTPAPFALGKWAMPVNDRRDPLRGRDAHQHRLAAGGHEPDAGRRAAGCSTSAWRG